MASTETYRDGVAQLDAKELGIDPEELWQAADKLRGSARPSTSTWSRPGWRTPVTDQKPSRGQCNSATQTVTLLQARAMAITPARERVRKARKRRRLGLRTVQVEVSEQVIDFLLARKYELERSDNASIGQAVSAFVSDAALEWT